MYQNIHVQRGKGRATIHIWDDKKGYYSFPHNEYAYIKDSSGLMKDSENEFEYFQ